MGGNKNTLLNTILALLCKKPGSVFSCRYDEPYEEYLSNNALSDTPSEDPVHICVVILGNVHVKRTLKSIEGQGYEHLDIKENEMPGECELVVIVDAGDVLPRGALNEYAKAFSANRNIELFYADEDELSNEGKRCAPRFKPEYSLTDMCAYDLIGRACAVKKSLFAKTKDVLPDKTGTRYAFNAECCALAKSIVHISRVLYTRCTPDKNLSEPDRRACEKLFLHAQKTPASVSDGLYTGSFHTGMLFRKEPRVSVIINNSRGIDALRRLLEELDAETVYTNLEFIVTDGGTSDPKMLRYYEILQRNKAATVAFAQNNTYPMLMNEGARHASGELLLFLDTDMHAFSPCFIHALTEQAMRKSVGACGAKIACSGGRLSHTGLAVGLKGWAQSPYVGETDEINCDLRKNRFVNTVRAVSALSGSCLMTRADVFSMALGMDETFTNAGADIDYCLKLKRRGLECVYTPYASMHSTQYLPLLTDVSEKDKTRCYDVMRVMLVHGDPHFSSNYDFSYTVPTAAKKPYPAVELNSNYK